MLLRLIILTSLAMFATLSLANRMEAVDRVVESGAPEAVTVERISIGDSLKSCSHLPD